MNTCKECRYAEWARTKTGALHPSGDGRCVFVWEMPPLPLARYWLGGAPSPYGGYLDRRQDFKEDCPCFEKAK